MNRLLRYSRNRNGSAGKTTPGEIKARLKSRLWLGVPVVGAATFAAAVPLMLWCSDAELSRVLLRSALSAGLLALGWGMGVWSATAPDEPEEEDEPDPAWMQRLPPRLRRAVGGLLIAVWIGLLFFGEIEALFDPERSAGEILGRTVLKLLMICMIVIPIVLVSRRRR